MISFYPGPSRVYDEIPDYVKDAYKRGILSMNHRNTEFVKLCEKTVKLLRSRLGVPPDYTIFFTSSATECWEIIAQSLTQGNSIHFHNGAFGEKWHQYANRIKPGALSNPFNKDEELYPLKAIDTTDVICITQNETSNGTMVSTEIISRFREMNPDHLVAVDATSSMGGIVLDFKSADVWFASVQKCFGLPAGLAVLICSPKAIERCVALDERNHYNSLAFMNEMIAKWQTPFTPNVLGIYLLMRTLKNQDVIEHVDEKMNRRFNAWYSFFEKSESLKPYIKNHDVRSKTILTIEGTPDLIERIRMKALKKGFQLGAGYGQLKDTTFRIANFPAIKSKEIEEVQKFIKKYI